MNSNHKSYPYLTWFVCRRSPQVEILRSRPSRFHQLLHLIIRNTLTTSTYPVLASMTTLSEVNFAQTFLQQLSARPIKYAADYTVPPSTLGPKPLMVHPPLHSSNRSSSRRWNDPNAKGQLPNQNMLEVFPSIRD